MAYPSSPTDGDGLRLGMFVKNVAGTLTAALGRVKNVTSTNPVGHLCVATHEDGEVATDAITSARPLVLIGSVDGSANAKAASSANPLPVTGYGNSEGTALASAARTATTNSADLSNPGARGVRVYVNVTAYTAGSLTPAIQVKDPVSGSYHTVLTGAAITATGLTVLTLYPGVTAAANVAVSEPLPKTWRVVMTPADATSITYSVGYALIV